MADDSDEFFSIVGTNVQTVRICPQMMFPEDGIRCPAILTDNEELQSPAECAQCQHRYTRCICREPIFTDEQMICWGDEPDCPYAKKLGLPEDHGSVDHETMMKVVKRNRGIE